MESINNRINLLKEKLVKEKVDGVLLYKPENRRYISGFTGSTGYVLITKNKTLFVTDFRYIEQAKDQCVNYEIVQINKDYTIHNIIKEENIKKLAIEDDYATYGFIQEITEKNNHMEIIPLKGLLTNLRMIKEKEEIDIIKKSANITDDAFNHILTVIKVGMTEREVANELEHYMKKLGASGPSFDFIVASGKRSSLPHGVASNKVIEDGDFVTIDMGCVYEGYCSDMTRTFVMGRATDKQKEIYDIVLEAQEAALMSIKPGITGFELDKVARDIISNKGYGENFGHSLGHGVGLEVHELPRIANHESANTELAPGMVITDEPGIYIPDFGGVRIEDLVVVTEDGCEILSKSTKELIEITN